MTQQASDSLTDPLLSAIYIYPVKSLAGIQVKQWSVEARGLKYDRQFMLVDQQYKFISQRQQPKMGLVKTQIIDDKLILSAANFSNITVPLCVDVSLPVSVTVWRDYCEAFRVSNEVDQWLSDFLNISCHLVCQVESSVRKVNSDYGLPTDKIYFADSTPFMLISESSLNTLKQQTKIDLSIIRFRPNLVIKNTESFAEDYWREIIIGSINFRLPRPCSRCAITTIKPNTTKFAKEPLATLNRTRKWQNKVYFGQNALHDNTGKLTQGDPLLVRKIGSAQPPLLID